MVASALLLTVLLTAVVVAGCSAPAQPASPAGETGGPRPGGALSLRITNDPYDWDLSYVGKSVPMNDMQSQLNASLLGFKAGPEIERNDLILRPEVAERWEISPDARSFTFHLRKGARFVDLPPVAGREVTSADVKWSYEYYSRTGQFKEKKLPTGQFEWFFEGLDAVETPDRYTAVVKFKAPFVPFISYAGSDFNAVVPREIYDEDGHHKDRVAGAGPFYLDTEASQKGTRWVFRKNANYWEEGKPHLDEVRWLTLPEEATAIAAFQTKQVDRLKNSDLTPRSVEDLKRTVPSAVFHEYLFPGGYHVYLQTLRPPLDKVEVRKAISLAIDRDELSRTLHGKVYPPAPPSALLGLFSEAEARKLVRHDVDEAKRLLTQAGYPNGLDLQWEYSMADGEQRVASLQLMQAQLKRAGINVTLKVFEQSDWSKNRKAKDFTINLLGSTCGGQQDEQDIPLYGCYFSKNKANYGGVNDPTLDRLLISQRQETDPEKRREIQRLAVRRVVERALGFDLYYPPEWEVWHPHLKNYAPNAGSKGPNLVHAWLEK